MTLAHFRLFATRPLAVCAAVACVCVVFAGNATADSYRMVPCQDETIVGLPAWTLHGNSIWWPDGQCGSPVQLVQQYLDLQELGPAWASMDIGAGRIESVTLSVTGSDPMERGVSQGFAVCGPGGWPTDCGTPVTANAEDPVGATAVALTRANGGVPNDADRLVMYAQCMVEICEQGSSLRFSDIGVEADDTTPPEIKFGGGYAVGDGPWHNDPVEISMLAADPESHVARTEFLVSNWVNPTPAIEHCRTSSSPLDIWACPAETSAWPQFGIRNLAQGKNVIRATAFNGAGLSSTDSAVVRMDTYPPHSPVNPTVGANANGWVIGSRHVVRWTNPYGWDSEPTDTQSGIARVRYDIDPDNSGLNDPDPVTVDGIGISAVPITLPGEGEWRVSLVLTDAAGNVSPESALTVRNDSGFIGASNLWSAAPVTARDVGSGKTFKWSTHPVPISGICGHRTMIDDSPNTDLTNVTSGFTVSGPGSEWVLSKEGLSAIRDGEHFLHIQAISCSGGYGSTSSESILFDRAVPTVIATPPRRWLTVDPHVRLRASDGAEEQSPSGVKTIRYSIDGGAEVVVADETALVDVPEGMHILVFRAFDEVGNVSRTERVEIGTDLTGPQSVFEPTDNGAPGRLDALINDSVSGVSEAQLEFCKADDCVWQRIGRRLAASGAAVDSVRLSASLPDDGSLPDGEYLIRALARDVAGNVSASSVRRDGSAMRMVLPLRPRAHISAELASAGGRKPRANAETFNFEAKTVLRGRLLDGSGAPVSNAELSVVAERRYGPKHHLGFVRTNGDGGYELRLDPDVSRTLVVRYDGDATRGPAATSIDQYFRAGVSLRATKKSVRSGSPLYLRGKVALRSASVPARGKRVSVEFCGGKRCSNLNLAARTDSDGSFILRFPTGGVHRTVRYRVRAVVRAEPGWPFADGSSDVIKVTVRG